MQEMVEKDSIEKAKKKRQTPMEKLEQYLARDSDRSDDGAKLLRELAYERLDDALRHAGLSQGDVLSENRLSKVLKISRTPLREALQKLATEGMIQVIPGRAVTVAAPSIKEVLDALHVRELLEPEVARMAATSLSEQDQSSLQQITSMMERHAQEGNRAEWLRADTRWHEVLNVACPNALLGQFVSQARNWVYGQGIAQHLTHQDLLDGTAEHHAIVDAIVARDADAAHRHVVSHLQHVRQNMFRRLGKY
jgi:GntR family transcriptional regulator, rspAB operon transcriptional repressor